MVEASKGKKEHLKEPWAIFKTLIALILIVLCFWASQWQYNRGVDRHARNSVIAERIAKPAIDLELITKDFEGYEWQSISTTGVFDSSEQILLRNRYSEGKYGYEVLTLFTSKDGRTFWVNRGWVEAGKTATTAPVVNSVPIEQVSLNARFRLDSSLPKGSFFAFPGEGEPLISKLNAQSQTETEKFYLDLLSGSHSSLTPAVTASLPELSDGPHLAYAVQWILFAGLVIYGRILIRRTR